MKIEQEDLIQKLDNLNEKYLIGNITKKFDKYDEERNSQLTDIKLVRDAIYNSEIPRLNGWDNKVELPDIYELAQTLKSHISENLYSHPDAMFDVSGTTPQTQSFANSQKAMLVNTFEQMNLENEMEKIIEEEGTDYSSLRCESKKNIACAASVAVTIKAILDTPILTEEGCLTDESLKAVESANSDISRIEKIKGKE